MIAFLFDHLATIFTDLNNSGPMVTVKALEFAVQRCESYLKFSYHDDIDSMSEVGVRSIKGNRVLLMLICWYNPMA